MRQFLSKVHNLYLDKDYFSMIKTFAQEFYYYLDLDSDYIIKIYLDLCSSSHNLRNI